MQNELVKAKQSLTKIFTSKDVNSTVCTCDFLFVKPLIEGKWSIIYILWFICSYDAYNAVTGHGWAERAE